MSELIALRKELKKCSNPVKAKILARFFKTGPGEYAEGDVFVGATVPDVRRIVKMHRDLSRNETIELLQSKIHEERMIALFILVDQYKRADTKGRALIYNLYIKSTKYINNWDLVDLTAGHIVGAQIANEGVDEKILIKLAKSKVLWERRIAMLATFYSIMRGDSRLALVIASILVNDSHDLIHKAVGWMLREVGKRCSVKEEEEFLSRHAATMPRTMLRYSLEHFSLKRKEYYMSQRENNKRNPSQPY